jgi:hypothetical protein
MFLQIICIHRQITYLTVCHLQLAGGSPLPSTPELNEEASGRSASPDVKSFGQGQCFLFHCVILSLECYSGGFVFIPLIHHLKDKL